MIFLYGRLGDKHTVQPLTKFRGSTGFLMREDFGNNSNVNGYTYIPNTVTPQIRVLKKFACHWNFF